MAASTKRLVIPIQPSAVERSLGNLTAVTIAGVAHELGLPIGVQTTRTSIELSIGDPAVVEAAKEEVRAALRRRPIDILIQRRIMRMLYATTVEEP